MVNSCRFLLETQTLIIVVSDIISGLEGQEFNILYLGSYKKGPAHRC